MFAIIEIEAACSNLGRRVRLAGARCRRRVGDTHGYGKIVHFAVLSAPRMRAPIFKASTVSVMIKGPAPGELLPVGIGALHEIVDGHRQVGHRLVQAEAEELIAERGEQQWRGFTGHTRGRQQHAGDEAGARRAIGIRLMTSERGRPSAEAASRSGLGTSNSMSSVVRTTTGITITASANEPASAEKPPIGTTMAPVDEQADDDRRRA